MLDARVLLAIAALGTVSYVMRVGGFLAAGAIAETGAVAKFLRLAPGNLFVAFVAAGCLDGGWPSVLGAGCAFITMAVTKKEWAALGAGFASAAIVSALMHL
ncbi:MAG TPA: AzlD domain-containing protein [Steroidobacteraceae bacterium]|jgi:uncharacterized membrane protein|nr:AzlD domain-containing protein [Steroidobacteraceae bacterium]